MANFHRAPAFKKKEFRRYLEKDGVFDNITSVLVTLYGLQEKPNNALEFIKEHLGTPGHAESLQQEVTELRKKCARLTEQNKELRAKLHHYEPESENGA